MNGERVLVVMSAYNEEDFIVPNIRHLYPYVDKIAVSTTNHITGKDSDDLTQSNLADFISISDKEEKILWRNPGVEGIRIKRDDYDGREGQIKTQLMNKMEPESGDWIWVVDADEFYPKRQLEMLRSRYILGHKAIQNNRVHCLMVSAMVFAYDFNHFYFARHGRFFKYSEGSYFNRVNHYTWANGTPVYGDEYGWDMPPTYLYMMHMRYVRKNIDRLRNRYIYRQDAAGQKKLGWFDNVFMVYPKDKKKALNWNKEHRGVEGFDGNLSGDLKYIINPDIPEELSKEALESLEFDLWPRDYRK
jgi:hypothetical protein